MYSAENIKRLRAEMKRQGIDGFFVPMADRFQGEYLPDSAKRIEYISGFTGSNAAVVVLGDKAAFFTDGRYTIQAKNQVDKSLFEIYSISENQGDVKTLKPEEWIKDNFKSEGKFALDAWLHTEFQVNKVKWEVESLGGQIVFIEENPLDSTWANKPAEPCEKAFPHKLEFSGISAEDKIKKVSELVKKHADILPITSADNICWLLNVRGGDIPYNPFVLSYAMLYAEDRVEWFVDSKKITPEIREWLPSNVEIKEFVEFEKTLNSSALKGKTLWLDSTSTPYAVRLAAEKNGAKIYEEFNPIILMQARKNKTEIEGTIKAHIRDGASITRFLAELSKEEVISSIDELQAEELLYNCRKDNEKFKELSFTTISGAGANAAIVHYHSSAETNKPLNSGALYLVDSGAQYLDGTTDITRTVKSGTATAEMKDRFTRVLKGHIQVAIVEFPEGTFGDEIDALARKSLSEIGLDYAHGTGHGVGSYLAVHEGPCRISATRGNVPLLENVIISNEPGYYKEGEYGIRIENLVYVVDTGKKDADGKRILGFKTLTLAPISKELIEVNMLNEKERNWLNQYHKRVREELTPALRDYPNVIEFLEEVTQPI